MTPQERARERTLIGLGLRAALAPLFRLLRPRMSEAEWRAMVEAAYPAVYRARMDYWRLAERAYRQERERVLGIVGPVEFPRRNYPPEALDQGLRETVKNRLDLLEPDDPVPPVVVEDALETVDRHAKAAGRDAQVDAARHDPRALGYARRVTGAYTCAFCTMLSSRGPIYRSASAALIRHEGGVATGEPYHDGCDCEAVPVFDRNNWEGREQYEELSRLWEEHGGTLQSWRRYIEGQRDEQQRRAA